MKSIPCAVAFLTLLLIPCAVGGQDPWRSQQLHRSFHAEGAAAGDLDGDGKIDLVEGPLWYRGPDFQTKYELAAPRSFPVLGYSDQFFSHIADVNGDSANDVIVIGFPGTPARLYLNPGSDNLDQHWAVTEITGSVDNESPAVVDLIPGGAPEIVCGHDSQYGYYSAGADATQPWHWNPISRPGACPNRFVHAMGVGDVDQDGRLDVLDQTFWWQQPSGDADPQTWTKHQWAPDAYGQGGAQICVADLDGDGDSDLVTSLNAHGYGLAWFQQTSPGQFERHDIMGDSSIDNPFGVCFSQLHAVALVDVDGDGAKDIVTGRRHFAHGGKDAGGLQDPVLYWFRHTLRDGAVEFVPHLIDDDSGVGVDVVVTDLNQDNKPDIVSASKHGLTLHFQGDLASGGNSDQLAGAAQRWRITAGRDQSKYAEGLSPQQAVEKMLVPDGFSVDLIASEPELTQPIAMCFDARGRIWVIEGHTYPTKAPDGQGKDRIVIFTDTNGDGTFDSKQLFAEGLNLASGIEVGFGGVFVGAAPELLFIPDADRDDQPDSQPIVLLDGWGHHDTHETLNSFTWGPDGWLYGCQGIFTHSNVGIPGTPDDQRQPFNAGVWRYHPSKKQFEVFAHGTSNPWGVDFNDNGDWFVSSCVIPHLFHIIQGGRYHRQAGQHFNPYTYDDIKTIADHAHYAGSIRDHAFWGENKITRPASALDTSVLGGGHAHCGLAIYNGGVFPSEYNQELIFHNLHGHRLVRDTVERNGSGYVGRHRPDFALAQDHNEIGVGVMVGPDGALYTSDWHDPQTCHNHDQEVWDRTDGRLFRIRYGDARPYKFDLWSETDSQLLERLHSDNGFFARQAARILQERAAAGLLDVALVDSKLQAWFSSAESTRDRLRAIWARYVIGGLDVDQTTTLFSHDDPYVRSWAIYLAGQPAKALPEQQYAALVDVATNDSSLIVQRYLAAVLQRLPLQQRFSIAQGLIANSTSSHDPNIPLLIWYGIEPLVEQDPDPILETVAQSGRNDLLRFVVRRVAESKTGRDALVKQLLHPTRAGNEIMILQELSAAATARAGVQMPSDWPAAFAHLSSAKQPRVIELARSVAVQFGDAAVLPHFRAILSDRSLPIDQRVEALSALRTAKDPDLAEQLQQLLDDSNLAAQAAAALAQFDHPKTAGRLIEQFANFDAATKTSALATLVARHSSADALITAMESNVIPADQVPAFIVRQILALDNQSLNQRLETVWGKITVSSAEMKDQYAKYRNLLHPDAIAGADASLGRSLYEANCGKCHKLFGVGGDIGPDITGANRNKVDYWLENILEPNALIGRAYQMQSFLTADGRVISGIVQTENDDAVTVQTATEKIVLSRDEIEQQSLSKASLMPSGQLETMTDDQVRQLFKYLMGPGQVPNKAP
ncbi:FG-GAP-like repeat-containing protein [Stieleria sp. TO1_6]|uniref:PVC-type heme-binding CxxCH protein n=1 Tax=Stieleria tagensis TaxID=2956795 RepID=UPI00209B27B4|nr:PVC-type heme-binding CxxCH protein [Stieleria tagensis]MCO8123901.1 FG-GAP-like repeat-containing protein [Stieleria tagensis]